MISVDNKGVVSVEGAGVQLLSELAVLMKSLVDHNVADRDVLVYCVELATMTPEQIKDLGTKRREAFALASMLFGEIE